MKQIIVLEPHEITRLMKGKTMLIGTPGGEVGLQFSVDTSTEVSEHRCDICGATEGMHGPFKTERAVQRHKLMLHASNGAAPKSAFRCDLCGATANVFGEPFKSELSVIHHRRVHKGGKAVKRGKAA